MAPGTDPHSCGPRGFCSTLGRAAALAPWQELAEVAVTEREERDDTLALLASFGRALGGAGSGVVSIAGEYAADLNSEAFAARFRNPALLLEACAASAVMTEASSSELRRQDPTRVWAAVEALAVPDEQELALDAIVLRAQQLLAVAEETEVVTFALSRRAQQRLPRAPKWKVVIEDDGAASVVCQRSGSLAAFYEVLAEFLLAVRD